MPTPLEQSVIKTVAWFSLFHYPMTQFEVWKWMIEPERTYDLSEVYRVLDESEWLRAKLQEQEGFFALKGTLKIQNQVHERHRRFLNAVRKYHALKRAAYYFQLFPGVQAVAAVNTLSWWHTTEESDIDLYIVTKPGHIWSTRLFLVAPFALIKKRPHEGRENPFCFSFFATRNALPTQHLLLERDYYMAFWCRALVPIFDRAQVFEQFMQENKWVQTVLPHAVSRQAHPYHAPNHVPALPVQHAIIDGLARGVQRSRMPEKIKKIANIDSRVVVSNDVLKFHENDRREQYRDQFEALLDRHL